MRLCRTRCRRNGTSLIEVTISTLLVGLVLVASMRCLGQVMRSRGVTSNDSRATIMAEELLTEIMSGDYEDSGGTPLFGLEPTESGPGRSGYDDVDDYHGWTASPPVDRAGDAIPNSVNWQRDVAVEFVDPSIPSSVVGLDQGVKRITVTVRVDGAIAAEAAALRSDRYVVP